MSDQPTKHRTQGLWDEAPQQVLAPDEANPVFNAEGYLAQMGRLTTENERQRKEIARLNETVRNLQREAAELRKLKERAIWAGVLAGMQDSKIETQIVNHTGRDDRARDQIRLTLMMRTPAASTVVVSLPQVQRSFQLLTSDEYCRTVGMTLAAEIEKTLADAITLQKVEK